MKCDSRIFERGVRAESTGIPLQTRNIQSCQSASKTHPPALDNTAYTEVISAVLTDSQLFFGALEAGFSLKLTDVNETALQQPISQSYSGGMLLFKDYASVMNHTVNRYFMCLELPS